MEPGFYHNLEIMRRTSVGLYLSDGTQDVLLPRRYIPENVKEGDRIEVFVYLDNENRIVATTLRPYAQVGEFAFLKVKDVTEHGAFLDWGIAKDLFIPYAEQRGEMKIGNRYLVFISMDDVSKRISGSAKWQTYIDPAPVGLSVGDRVELLIAERTDLGYRAIINHMFEGLLYKNEVFEEIIAGDYKVGYITEIRADGKIDLALQMPGYAHIEGQTPNILEALKKNHGTLALGDKSSPEEIYANFKISKKAFKKALGALYKQRLITVSDFETKLV